MTDIVQRLRLVDPNQVLLAPPPHDTSYLQVGLLCHEAAAEIERLRADAERYRWMKLVVKRIPPAWELMGWDAAIDAAMKEGKR